MPYCKRCNEHVSSCCEDEDCPIDSTGSFLLSAAVGAGTDSAILGTVIGGNVTGGILGDLLDGDLMD